MDEGGMIEEIQGPPCPFRAVGFTSKAWLHKLSPAGQAIIAEHNGVPVDRLPFAYRYSSGPYMHAWMEALGSRKANGQPTRHESGRWLLPEELAA
jgi:hypothetical protein